MLDHLRPQRHRPKGADEVQRSSIAARVQPRGGGGRRGETPTLCKGRTWQKAVVSELAPVEMGFCNQCDEENHWSEDMDKVLLAEFPDESKTVQNGLPANHPYWTRWAELVSKHHQPVANFDYDDKAMSLCAKHLRDLAAEVEGYDQKTS